jgi:hypothetical protein
VTLAPPRDRTADAVEAAPAETMILKTVGTLALLTLALPANLTVTAIALARLAARPRPRLRAAVPRTVLISGGKMTKALHLARAFHRAGHRVILVESRRYRLTGHRFSRAVSRFYTVPPADALGYPDALAQIVRREHVDLYVPVCSPASSHHEALAKARLPARCEVLHLGADTIDEVDDKSRFAAAAVRLGLTVPETHRITDPGQVAALQFGDGAPFVLKSIAYDPIRRLDLTLLPRPTLEETERFAGRLPISESNPWIMQSFVAGQEYCTYSVAHQGRLTLHCCCESSAFQLNYTMVDVPEIEAWVRHFVGEQGLTGQLSFDFIRGGDGRFYAIECNPRTHSAISMFYDHPGVAGACLEGEGETVTPLPSSRPTYWLYHELWRLLTNPRGARACLRRIAEGKEAIFDWGDPLPFLAVHHLQIPSLLVGNLRRRRPWLRIDFNIGKLVEPAGD